MTHAVLFSIKPRFAELIFGGTKSVELRRRCPKLVAGDLALIYASTPRKALVGAFEIGGVESGTPSSIWEKYGAKTGISRPEFDDYFDGRNKAHAIKIRKAWRLASAVELSNLRDIDANFRPPQSYLYLEGTDLVNRLY
jgi:predicted transcriptional regulator